MTPLGRTNSEVQQLRRLSRRRSARFDAGCFVIDGPVLVAEALAAGADIDTVYVEQPRAHVALIDRAQQAGVRVVEVDEGVLDAALDLGSAQGVAATAALLAGAESSGDEVIRAGADSGRPVIGLVQLADPGNVGTVIRQAEAFGAAGVLIIGGGVDLHNPKTVRASAGALFRVAVGTAEDPETAFSTARSLGTVCAATAGGGRSARELAPLDAPLGGASLVLIGNEAHGLADDVVEAADLVLSIPMEGNVESLNAATAAAVVLYESARQRSEAERSTQESGSGRTPGVGHDGHTGDATSGSTELDDRNRSSSR